MMKGLFFIINPVAGDGKSLRAWKKMKKELEAKQISYRSFFTNHPGHAEILARQIATIQDYRLKTIIGVGGDGTLNEMINGLQSFQEVRIGFIYSGSGNDSKKRVLPTNPVKALRILLKKVNKPFEEMDVGELHFDGKGVSRSFVNQMGVGLLAEVYYMKERIYASTHHPLIKRVMFMTSFIKVLGSYKPFSLTLDVDGITASYENVWFLSIANLPKRQGNLLISPKASARDGKLNLMVLANLSRVKLILLFLTGKIMRKQREESVNELVAERVKVKTDTSLFVYADGDIMDDGSFRVHVKASSASYIA
ncbi:diacylglycerol/lipid kinase family protein [Bacillus weihaiensis]|uniref:DAGKc domain-containing protein n=1 Tax=Bacillus weihaiensis TaxID=1547283 RepID=A0A1L3MNV7_9BACI|nr:YegS/Rv2252/BmrU family lipid kinase [Bacillus weihaiensis]APH04036.1 hypothetical protein A9C19_04400 [Bacillus weihaiensis]